MHGLGRRHFTVFSVGGEDAFICGETCCCQAAAEKVQQEGVGVNDTGVMDMD